MAKITAADIEKDLRNDEFKIQDLTTLINKNENEYSLKKNLIKTNEGLLKTIKKSIRKIEEDAIIEGSTQQKTVIEKVNQQRKEETARQKAQELDTKVNQVILQSLLGVGIANPILQQIQEEIPTGEKPDGSNGRLKPDQLKDVGDGFKLWTAAADAYLEMKAAAAKDKVYFKLSSAYRTIEEQQSLVDDLGEWSPTNPGAAPAGTSPHGWGIAIDISSPGAQQWINRYGAKYGWIPTVSNEPWHFEWKGRKPEAQPVSNTNVQQISKSIPKANAGIIAVNPTQNTQPPYQILEPQIAAAPSTPINKPRSNPFFIVPTG